MGQSPSSPTQYHPSAVSSSQHHDGTAVAAAAPHAGRRFALRSGHRRSASARSSSSASGSGAGSLIEQFHASHAHVDRALSQRQAFAQAWHADGPGQQTPSLAGPMRARMHAATMPAGGGGALSGSFSAPGQLADAALEPAERIPRSFSNEDGALHSSAAYRLASAPAHPRIDELPEPLDAPSVSQPEADKQVPAQAERPRFFGPSPPFASFPLPEPLARALKTGLGKADRPPDAGHADARASSAEPALGHDTPGRSSSPFDGKRLSSQSANSKRLSSQSAGSKRHSGQSADDAQAAARRSWASGSAPGSSISRSVLARGGWTSAWEDRRGSDVRASWSASNTDSGPSAPSARIASPSPMGSSQSPAEAAPDESAGAAAQRWHLEQEPQGGAQFVTNLAGMEWTHEAAQPLARDLQPARPAVPPHAAAGAQSGAGDQPSPVPRQATDLPRPHLPLGDSVTPIDERTLVARPSPRRKPVPVEEYLEGPSRPWPASRPSTGSDYAAVLAPSWMESHRTSLLSRSSHGTEQLHSQIEQIRAGPRPQIDRAASQELLGMQPSSPPTSPPEKRVRTFNLLGRIRSRVRRTSEPRSPSVQPPAQIPPQQADRAAPQAPESEGARAFPMRLGRKRATSAALPSSIGSASGRRRAASASAQNTNPPSTARASSERPRPAGLLRSLSTSSASPPLSRHASARGSVDLPRSTAAAADPGTQPRPAYHEGAWLTGAALGAGPRVLGRPPITEHLSPQSRSLGAFGDNGSSSRLVDDNGAGRPRSIADEAGTALGSAHMERRLSGEQMSRSPSGDGRRRSWNWRRRGSASAEAPPPTALASGEANGRRGAVEAETSTEIVSAAPRPSTPEVVTIGRQPSSPGQSSRAQSGFSSLAPPPAPAPVPPSRPSRRGPRRTDSATSSVTSPSTPAEADHAPQASADARLDFSGSREAVNEPLELPRLADRPASGGSSSVEAKEVLISEGSGDETKHTAAESSPGADAVPANVHAFAKPGVTLSSPPPDAQFLAGSGWTVQSSTPSSTTAVPSTSESMKREKPIALEARTPDATLRHVPHHLVADSQPREYASPISRMRTHARSSSDPHSLAGSPASPLPALLQTEAVMATVAPADADARASQRPLSAVRLASRMSGSSASTWGANTRPRSALSPMPALMLDTRMDRSSWQSSQGPWLADVVHVDAHHDAAHGFATAERSRLPADSSRSRTTSAPSARSADMLRTPAPHELSPIEDYSPAPAPRAETAVQASLAALAALENSEADGWQARWARDRLFGIRESEMSAAGTRLSDSRCSRSPATERLEELYHARPRHRHSPYASRSDLRGRISSDDQAQYSSGRSDASRRRRRRPARSLRSRTDSANAFSHLRPQIADEVAMLGLTTGSSDSEMTAAQMASLEARIRQAASRNNVSARAQLLRASDAASQRAPGQRLDVASFATPPRGQPSSAVRRAPIPAFASAGQSLDLANVGHVPRNATAAEWDETVVPALARRMQEGNSQDPTGGLRSLPPASAEQEALARVPFPSAELPDGTASPSLRRRPRLNLVEAARSPHTPAGHLAPLHGDSPRARAASPSGSKGSRPDGGSARRRAAVDTSGSKRDRRGGHLAAAEPSRSSRKSSNAGSQRSRRPAKKGYSGEDILAWQAALHVEAP